jgi:uncharacterized membrane protein
MAETPNRWNDEMMDQVVSVLLRTGVILSSIVVLIGGIMYLVQYRHLVPDYRTFQSEPSSLRNLDSVLAGVLTLHSRSWMQLGLLLLVATPVARVAFSVFAFIRERDKTYVVLTFIVLVVLLAGLLGK